MKKSILYLLHFTPCQFPVSCTSLAWLKGINGDNHYAGYTISSRFLKIDLNCGNFTTATVIYPCLKYVEFCSALSIAVCWCYIFKVINKLMLYLTSLAIESVYPWTTSIRKNPCHQTTM